MGQTKASPYIPVPICGLETTTNTSSVLLMSPGRESRQGGRDPERSQWTDKTLWGILRPDKTLRLYVCHILGDNLM
jgi:hypothetical protein